MKRQGLIITLNQLHNLIEELEEEFEWKNNVRITDDNRKFQINIINKEGLSDTWEIEKTASKPNTSMPLERDKKDESMPLEQDTNSQQDNFNNAKLGNEPAESRKGCGKRFIVGTHMKEDIWATCGVKLIEAKNSYLLCDNCSQTQPNTSEVQDGSM